jgi:hypothetical protein
MRNAIRTQFKSSAWEACANLHIQSYVLCDVFRKALFFVVVVDE